MSRKTNIIGKEEIKAAAKLLLSYKEAKAPLDNRIKSNEEWFKLRYQGEASGDIGESSAWLFNSILNKHADAMDSYPEPNVLPRESSDKEDARLLSKIIPVILEQREFEQTYSDTWWYKLKTGTGAYGVFWNSELEGGLGDIDIKQIELLNLFWEPGIKRLEDSSNIFYLQAVDKAALIADYPHLKKDAEEKALSLKAYSTENGTADNDKIIVVDWYYKVKTGGKWVLHYCKFAGDALLFASQNEERFKYNGFYDHGRYPFILDTMFVSENSPAGFGFVDIMKGSQRSIDILSDAILNNTILGETPRWFISDAAGINEDEYADWDQPFIHTTGRIDDQTVKQVSVEKVSDSALELLRFKVDELKETSGNRDFNAGGTFGGVTAASAIIALQEAQGKLTRDTVKSSFRAYTKICYLIIELIRQFYTEPRTFRITGGGRHSFETFSGEKLRSKPCDPSLGLLGLCRKPVFDIYITPQKQNPYEKAEQNELAKELFSLGILDPKRKEEALLALKIMNFDGKEELLQAIEN